MAVLTRLYLLCSRRVAALFSCPSGSIQAGVHPPEYLIPNLPILSSFLYLLTYIYLLLLLTNP
jgi:hypothetical protein